MPGAGRCALPVQLSGNARAGGALANLLRERGVKPGDSVAVAYRARSF